MAFYPEQILDTIALCEGYDGLGLGISFLEPAYRNICGVEREIFPVVNMAKKNQEIFMVEKPQWSDVSTFRIPRLRGLVDCITAGIPCQPFSCAGKQRGLADERWIWPSIFRIIADIHPRWLFFEEVTGFKKHGLPILLRDLAEIGYDAEWDCFRAGDVEAPHKKRERIFILAKLADATSGEFQGKGRFTESGNGIGSGCEELANADNGRRSAWKSESARQGRLADAEFTGEQGERLDDSQPRCGNSRTERVRRTSRTDADGTGAGTRLALANGQHNDDAGFGAGEICGKQSEPSEIFGGVADPDLAGLEGHGKYGKRLGELPAGTAGDECGIWPARDGEAQYEWEPPRLVESSRKFGDRQMQARRGGGRLADAGGRPSESSLGRDAYGITSRVDELRLCGNGVIPLMAALAWYVLKSTLAEGLKI